MRHDAWSVGTADSPVETPNLAELAKESVVFDRAYSQCPSCVPARGCALTGLNPWHLGVLGMGFQ